MSCAEPSTVTPFAAADFRAALSAAGLACLRRQGVTTVQVNVGKRCNQACHHCHVDAGPNRTESMGREVAERVATLVAASPEVELLDLTGGAPELNPNFPWLVEEMRRIGRRVMVRCNLTVTSVPGYEWLPEFYRDHQVELVCSLPCYTEENVDRQRGRGVFRQSIAALQRLNELGFGMPGSPLVLHLVYNPGGAFLPPPQAELEAAYRHELQKAFGIQFHHLLTLANMPIKRFAEQLQRWGKYEQYMALLVNHFNPATLPHLMCRTLVSVGWQGTLYDCDFNQMLELPLCGDDRDGAPPSIWDIESFGSLAGREIAVGSHCFACTAGAGSSCSGALTSTST